MMGWLGWALCFSGSWMIGNRDRRGFLVCILSEVVLCVHGITIVDHSLVVANVAWAALHVRNLRKWSRTNGEATATAA